ncbi:hypothetical protein HY624_03050 [Candidatus Uhrbacteria bacterium]|nr:hypothetical protein [Candidatus Uhrbacteria bacterium]
MGREEMTESDVFTRLCEVVQSEFGDTFPFTWDVALSDGTDCGDLRKAQIIECAENLFDMHVPYHVEDALVTVRDLVQDLTWRLNGSIGDHPVLGTRGVA